MAKWNFLPETASSSPWKSMLGRWDIWEAFFQVFLSYLGRWWNLMATIIVQLGDGFQPTTSGIGCWFQLCNPLWYVVDFTTGVSCWKWLQPLLVSWFNTQGLHSICYLVTNFQRHRSIVRTHWQFTFGLHFLIRCFGGTWRCRIKGVTSPKPQQLEGPKKWWCLFPSRWVELRR